MNLSDFLNPPLQLQENPSFGLVTLLQIFASFDQQMIQRIKGENVDSIFFSFPHAELNASVSNKQLLNTAESYMMQ